MRTTLDIEEDVLQAAKELAQRQGSTAGHIISLLARRGLTAPAVEKNKFENLRGGVPILNPRGELVTLEHTRKLMDQEGI
jgi:hypothetical protein